MGICMDTEASAQKATTIEDNEDSELDQKIGEWRGGGRQDSQIITRLPKSGNRMANVGKVKFQPPNVPVIFVLGGPGSGKVTHCDTLMQEKRGVTHINMMDLLQQYAIGNDMQDFSQLPSKTVTEVLMLEMKMAPAAKTYLISGYPRSMRDVVEYSEKIQVINGVILISWRQGVLQKQIDYGAKLGHVVLSLAKMELENFFKSVMPVADYFDQSDMLVAINGERTPSEVYKDFRAAVLDILQTQENQEAVLNGVAGIGNGIDDIPGSIVSVDTAPSPIKTKVPTQIVPEARILAPKPPPTVVSPPPPARMMNGNIGRNAIEIESFDDHKTTQGSARYPPIIFVIGGPGSSKSTLCLKAIGMNPGWGHFSIGRSLRALAESEPKPMTENFAIKEAIAAGEMVSRESLEKLIHSNILQMMNKKGIIIDGYPREMNQILDFQDKYNQKPPIILLDCSKLQLGRGRLDDTVSSFRRRLELFRELTLPMLKAMDADGRLTIVDGDTDSSSVQREFERIVRQQIESLGGSNIQTMTTNFNRAGGGGDYRQQNDEMTGYSSGSGGLLRPNGVGKTTNISHNDDGYIEDLEEHHMPGAIPTISKQVSNHMALANGHIGNTSSGKFSRNRTPGAPNGYVANGRSNFRTMLEDAEMNSHI